MKVASIGWPTRLVAARFALLSLIWFLALPTILLQSSQAHALERRVALVIGNSHYSDGWPALNNPANDAADIADALRSMNFEVTTLYDLSERDFRQSLLKFSHTAATAQAALIFYAGHAVHLDGESYLMPVGLQVRDKADVKFDAVSVDDDIIQRTLADVPVKILILDACRDNPIAKLIDSTNRTRSIGSVQGLAPIALPRSGLLIAYSTGPNQVAEDGQGRNSPFTKALKKHIREPGVDIQTMLAEVSADVRQDTNDRQRPETSDTLPRGFFLSAGESDSVVWNGIKATGTIVDLKDFITRFPTSQYVGEANAKIDYLSEQERSERVRRDTSSQVLAQAEARARDAESRALDADTRARAAQAEVEAAKSERTRMDALSRQAKAETEARVAALEARARKAEQEAKAAELQASSDMSPPIPDQGRRVALVIGNSAYQAVPMLSNPRSDAEAVAGTLRAVGFTDVSLVEDASLIAMKRALRDFRDKADGADWAMVYYAGHGIDVAGKNYLIPVDAHLQSDRDTDDETVSIDYILDKIRGAKSLHLVILDACRENPFLSAMHRQISSRGVARGLAPIEPHLANELVFYAAKDGEQASDGDIGGHSPFAAALIRRLAMPQVEINKVFRLVTSDVLHATGNRQQPFVYGSTPGEQEFYFRTK